MYIVRLRKSDLFRHRLGSYAHPFDLTASSSAQLTADKQMLAALRNVYVKKIIKAIRVFQRGSYAFRSDDDVLKTRAERLANKMINRLYIINNQAVLKRTACDSTKLIEII